MNCECLPIPIVVETPIMISENVLQACGGSYGAGIPANLFPDSNPAFFIAKNEFGADTLYALQNAISQINVVGSISGAGVGKQTPWSEMLAIRMFGGRPKPPNK